MSAWQSEHFVLTLLNTNFVWHDMQDTLSCMPRKGYLVWLWSNSGTLRIGFHPLKVWQFWQGIFKGPCGLRVVLLLCCAGAIKAHINANKIGATTVRIIPNPPSRAKRGRMGSR